VRSPFLDVAVALGKPLLFFIGSPVRLHVLVELVKPSGLDQRDWPYISSTEKI
jgi:hypothetical protein